MLDLHSNILESLNGVSALTNLRRLNLAGNHISQLCPLSMLTCLEDLNLSRNFIISLKAQQASSCPENEDAKVASLPNSLRKLNLAANRFSWAVQHELGSCVNCIHVAVYDLGTCTQTVKVTWSPLDT